MAEGNAFVYTYLLDGRGGGKTLEEPEIENWNAGQGLLWVHLDSRQAAARSWLSQKSGLKPLTCESLLDQETRPRSILTEDGLLLILRGVNCNPGEDPEDMVAIRMLFTEDRIITLRYRRVRAIQDITEAIDDAKGPESAGDFLVSVADRISYRMGEVVSDLDDKVDEIEDSVLSAESQGLRTLLADLRRKTISLRRYIAPQREVLNRLLHERLSWLDESHLARLREISERTARFVEDIDSSRERAAITHEELNSKLSEQMNKAMYTLSIVAAIFLPLGLLTGLLGINVGGIPGTESKWAFILVTTGLVIIALGLVAWFKKIKWL
jgi:zinc transporter